MISPWGVGAICNFPGDESLMVCGLDAWKHVFNTIEGYNEFVVREERLERRLGVSHFRLPPDFRQLGPGVSNPSIKIPFVRFPQWHYCPKCGSMNKLSIFGSKQRCDGPNYSDGMSCHSTTRNRRPWLIPSRFITVCGHGHIADFPFIEWVHRDHPFDDDCRLRLRAGRSASSLSGIEIECITCNLGRSMAGAFNDTSMDRIERVCNGYRPWLGEIDENTAFCGHSLRVIQRGASNVYFPQVRSSIYLPKWDIFTKRRIIEILERDWDRLTRSRVNGELNIEIFKFVADKYNVDVEELLTAANQRLELERLDSSVMGENDSEELYRRSEYDAILSTHGGDNQDFYVTNIEKDRYELPVRGFFKSISLIHKLRETRALVGFSRLLPEDGKSLSQMKSELALNDAISWLPAIIVKGEGIFFEFDSELIDQWLENQLVISRFDLLNNNYDTARQNRGQSTRELNPRFVLIHTFAHILINQLSFVCGYGSSALRERIYCDCDPVTPENPMNGVIIYTASGDSEGSLGGLVRQGQPGYLEDIVDSALRSAQWCSADPICIDSGGQGPDSCNLAACHNCAILPETCCEEGNRLLDRAFVTGKPDNQNMGYFGGFNEL